LLKGGPRGAWAETVTFYLAGVLTGDDQKLERLTPR